MLSLLDALPIGGVLDGWAGPGRAVFRWVPQHGRQCRALRWRQPRGILAPVAARGGMRAVDAVAEFGHVRVHLQDPRLRPQRLDQHRVPGLDALAHPARRAAVAAPQEQVLGDLLADRAGPAHPAAAGVAGARLLDGLEVETAVAGEVLVLGRDRKGT